MTTEFTQFNLHPQLVQAVSERGYVTPTPIQEAILPIMMVGEDVIGQAQTGTGKTAAFALPILQNFETGRGNIQSLVLAPTRELALQVAEAIKAYGSHLNVRVLPVYGGAPYAPQIRQLKQGTDIVVGTPGRIIDLIQKEVLDLSQVNTVVLDEADEMLSMGFIEDIETILASTPPERQTALFSATLPTEIHRLAERYMRNPRSVAIQREQVTVETIEQSYYLVNASDKLAALTRLFEMDEVGSALIFVRTRSGTGELANQLTVRGFPAEALNGDLSQDARESTLNRFRQNLVKVLVATDVAARGLDIDDISHVFNFDLPEDPEIYVHRIGRTGRAGKTGKAISLVTPAEKRRLGRIEAFTRKKIAKATLPTEDDIRSHREQHLMRQVEVWLQRGRYKRERELVEELVFGGQDPIEIAAAALKIARAEERQRPIEAISAVVEKQVYRSYHEGSQRPAGNGNRANSKAERSSNRSRRPVSNRSHEPGMVRLSLNLGKSHGIRPGEVVGVIAARADIPGSRIGKIFIEEQQTLVDVPEELVSQVLAKTGGIAIRRQPIYLQLA